MKNFLIIIFCCIICAFASSCKKGIDEFLDKAPGVDVTEDTIFSSQVQIDKFMMQTYRMGIHSTISPGGQDVDYNNTNCFCATYSDEGEYYETWYTSQFWNSASITSSDNLEDTNVRWKIRWQVIRRTNIILERIDNVQNVDEQYKNQVKGEALFIRALNYFEMLKRYGAVPIVAKRIQLTDDLKIPRATLDETVKFISNDCSQAAELLPPTYQSSMRGRASKTAALMLKSKALLYAASPLFNTAQPYLDLGANNSLICYGNTDVKRWEEAALAAKAAIDAAPAGNFKLITDKGAAKNYKYTWEQNDNAEIVLANKSYYRLGNWSGLWTSIIPVGIMYGWTGVQVPFNFVKFYEKKDGTKQTWNDAGGNDLSQKYSELDPRFAASVAYNGMYWTSVTPNLKLDDKVGTTTAKQCKTGAYMRKFLGDAFTSSNYYSTPNIIIFRLAEAYLNYAEALNEWQGPVQEAYDAVNTIRDRSGMPPLPTGLTKDQFRERVRNERAVEMAFEDHRFWDIRRWMIAENDGVMKGAMWGIKISPIPSSTEFRYVPYVFETRSFNRNMYLHPFPKGEVFKGYLIQNPGW